MRLGGRSSSTIWQTGSAQQIVTGFERTSDAVPALSLSACPTSQGQHAVVPSVDSPASSARGDIARDGQLKYGCRPVNAHSGAMGIGEDRPVLRGVNVWIAQNDRTKSWNDETLGGLSIQTMPSLGMDELSQQIIRMIDVVWLKKNGQGRAAFEIEYTTSIYSEIEVVPSCDRRPKSDLRPVHPERRNGARPKLNRNWLGRPSKPSASTSGAASFPLKRCWRRWAPS